MRLLYLIDSLAAGGAETSLAAIAPRLVDAGVTLEIVGLKAPQPLREQLERSGVEVTSLHGGGGRAARIRRAYRLLAERRPDVLHTTLFEADIIGRIAASLARVPVVSSLVNVAYGPEQMADPLLRRWKLLGARSVDALTAQRVARFHAITAYVADVMARRLWIARDRIDVVPRGRDPAVLGTRTAERRSRVRAELDILPGDALVLVVARQEHQKGIDILLRAACTVLHDAPRARILVAGRDGNQTSELRRITGQLGLEGSVRFLGARTDVPDLMCAADVFVLPSRWEGLGSVLLEAMALEAPIVASDLPPVREIVTDGVTARLVPQRRPDSLARGILDQLADPDAAQERAAAARARFLEHFTIDRVADGMLAFYDRVLAG